MALGRLAGGAYVKVLDPAMGEIEQQMQARTRLTKYNIRRSMVLGRRPGVRQAVHFWTWPVEFGITVSHKNLTLSFRYFTSLGTY